MSKEITILNELSTAFTEFKRSNDSRLDELEARITRPPGGRVAPAESAEDRERKAALLQYMRVGQDGLAPDIRNALSVGADPEGGYFVSPDMSGRIVQRIFETSPIRQVANVVETSTDALEGVNDLNEAGAGWVGESEGRPETTTPDVGVWRIPIHEEYAMPIATQKVLEDADRNVENWLIDKVSRRFSRLENTAFVNGTGVTQPRGFLTYPTEATDDDSREWGRLQHAPTGGSGAFASSNPADALYDLVFSLKADYLSNAVWMMARSTMAEVAKLKDGNGRYLLTTGGDIGQRTPFTLLGYPVILAEDMPAIAADSLSIAFGDFTSGYQIVDRIGITLLRDPYTTKGKVKFYTRKRTGADVLDFDAIKLMKFSAS